MDVAHPIRAVVPTLDGPVLEVLAGTTQPLTGLEIHRMAGKGSPSGVRLVLLRLAQQGLVHAQERSTATFYTANRDHLAWPAIDILTDLRRTFLERLQGELGSWQLLPLHASLFGSAARSDGDAESDIDVLLVRPSDVDEDASPWADQLDDLRRTVRLWTGNHCQAFQIDQARLAEHVKAGDPLVDEWLRDSVTLSGPSLKAILRKLGGGNR